MVHIVSTKSENNEPPKNYDTNYIFLGEMCKLPWECVWLDEGTVLRELIQHALNIRIKPSPPPPQKKMSTVMYRLFQTRKSLEI